MKNDKTGIVHLIFALKCSLSGIAFCLEERAFRQELMLGLLHVIVLLSVQLLLLSKVIMSVLYLLILLVEMLNTAIEAVVDIVSPDYNLLAKKAKDVASAAVLVALILYTGGWVVVLCVEKT